MDIKIAACTLINAFNGKKQWIYAHENNLTVFEMLTE